MKQTQYDRTEMLLGKEAFARLREKRVLCFGLGGVGGHCAESLARTGIRTIGLVDDDVVDLTNLNRQILALHSSLGRQKTEVMRERIQDIDPSIEVRAFPVRLTEENLDEFCLAEWDYIVDAIDDVPAKLALIRCAVELGVPVISCMGTGNKMDPSRLQVADLSKTHTCPLAKAVRKGLRERGIANGVKVVFSDECPARSIPGKSPASNAFVPAGAGILMASVVVSDLL